MCQSLSQAQAGEGDWELQQWQRSVLEKGAGRRGHKVEDVELDLKWLQRDWEKLGGGLWLEGSKEEEKSEKGSGDIVLGGCGPEWAKYLRSRTEFTERGLRAKIKESLNIRVSNHMPLPWQKFLRSRRIL